MSMSFSNIHILNRSGLPPEEVHTALLEYYKAGGYVEAGKNEYSDKDVAFKVSGDGRWISCFDEDWGTNHRKTDKALKTLAKQFDSAGVSFMAMISDFLELCDLAEMVLYNPATDTKDVNAVGDWGLYHSTQPMPKGDPGKWLTLAKNSYTAEDIQGIWEADYVLPDETLYKTSELLGIDRDVVMSGAGRLYTKVTWLRLRKRDRPAREMGITITEGLPKLKWNEVETKRKGELRLSIYNYGGSEREAPWFDYGEKPNHTLFVEVYANKSDPEYSVKIENIYIEQYAQPEKVLEKHLANPAEKSDVLGRITPDRIMTGESFSGIYHAKFTINIPEGVNEGYQDAGMVDKLIEFYKIDVIIQYKLPTDRPQNITLKVFSNENPNDDWLQKHIMIGEETT